MAVISPQRVPVLTIAVHFLVITLVFHHSVQELFHLIHALEQILLNSKCIWVLMNGGMVFGLQRMHLLPMQNGTLEPAVVLRAQTTAHQTVVQQVVHLMVAHQMVVQQIVPQMIAQARLAHATQVAIA